MSRKKAVYQYTKDVVHVKDWTSRSEAARETGIKVENISGCANGRLRSAGGYIWRATKLKHDKK